MTTLQTPESRHGASSRGRTSTASATGTDSSDPSPAPGRRSVPLPVVLLVCLPLLAVASLLAARSLALAGDGAYYLIRILDTGEPYGPDARVLGNAVREAPVLVGMRLGLTDTHLLSVLLGVGFLVLPAAVWCIAIAWSRTHDLAFSAVAVAAAICAGTTWYFGVSENVLAVPLTVLVAVLLWLPQDWRWRHATLAVVASAILIASYETAVLTGAVLAVWAVWRAARASARLERWGTAVVAVFSTAAALNGAAASLGALDQPNAQSVLLVILSGEPWELYLALASSIILIYALAWPISSVAQLVWLGVGVVGAAAALLGVATTSYNAYAARGGAVLAGVLVELFLFGLWIRARQPASSRPLGEVGAVRGGTRWLLLVPVVFVSALMLASVNRLGGWSASLQSFKAEVDEATGPVSVDDALPRDRREVLWDWTSSSLSLVVRGDAGAGILLDSSPSWIPFPPMAARQQLDDKYVWRS